MDWSCITSVDSVLYDVCLPQVSGPFREKVGIFTLKVIHQEPGDVGVAPVQQYFFRREASHAHAIHNLL